MIVQIANFIFTNEILRGEYYMLATKKSTAALIANDVNHPGTPGAKKRAEAERSRLEEEAKRKKLENEEASRTNNESPKSIDSDNDVDPDDESRSATPESAGDPADETRSTTPDAAGHTATDSPRQDKLNKTEHETTSEPEKGSPLLRALMYTGALAFGFAAAFYVYYSTVLKSQNSCTDKFSLNGISELINKLFSRDISR